MKRSALVLIVFVLMAAAACSAPTLSPSPSPSPAASPSSQPASPPASSGANDLSRYFSIDEVGLEPNGYVTLLNYTDVAASLDKVFVCQSGGCIDLPDAVVAPHDVARIAIGDGTGLEKVVMTGANLDLPPNDGEVAVYGSDNTSDSASMRSYLQWGSTPHALTPVAVEAGLWIATAYAPTGPNATRLWKTEANLWVWDPGQ